MLVSRIMRHPVTTITPDTSVRTAATLMSEMDIGALIVCDGGLPVGIITDRDIVVRWASRTLADCPVTLLMTSDITTCTPDHAIKDAAHLMSNQQIRRIVVVDLAGKVVGIVTLGDIANDGSEELAGQTLGEIVERRGRY